MIAGWSSPPLSEIVTERRGTSKIASDSEYQLWSVPSFAERTPEIALGSSIRSAKRPVQSGDVLLCKINPRINRVWVVGQSDGMAQVASTEWMVLEPRDTEVVSPRWLEYYFSSAPFREWLTSETSGATGSHTRAKPREVLRQPIPLPPLTEQERIVAILDEAMAAIDTATHNTQQNQTNTQELLRSSAQDFFRPSNGSWRTTTVGNLVAEGILAKPIDGNHGETHPKKKDFVDKGVPFIMASDLVNGAVDQTNCHFITRSQADGLRKGFAKHGDVLLSHKGTIGRAAILSTSLDYVMLTPQVTFCRIL